MRYTLPTVLMTCALLFLLSQFGLATDFYIGTQSDLPDTNLGDGLCRTATGTCSLRAAIMQANFHSDIDNIYDNHGWTINVASPLEVSSTIRFYGAGSDGTKTNIDGGDAVEVLRIVPGPTSVYVSDLIMEDVRIRNGRRNIAAGPDVRVELRGCVIIGGQADLGGGIRAHDSTVIVENSRIENNTAPGGGGGIYFDSEDSTKYLYLYETDVEDNTTTGDGGGIHAVATGSVVNLTNSRIEGNQAPLGNGGGVFARLAEVRMTGSTLTGNLAKMGGGVYSMIDQVRIVTSSIWGNIAALGGGGVYLTFTQTGVNEIINTTISGNSTSGNGGGIYLDTTVDTWYGLELSNCTITGNTADLNSDDVGDGGGIYRDGDYQPFPMQNTILAGNNDLSSSGYLPDCVARINTKGYNIVGVETPACIMVGPGVGDRKGTVASPFDPMIGPRTNEAYNAYHPVLEDSPAVDGGNPAGCTEWGAGTLLGNDQIGGVRPQGLFCDPGAIESPFSTMASLDIAIGGSGGGGLVTSSPSGISCPSNCQEWYYPGTQVTLTSTPNDPYYDFFCCYTGSSDCLDGHVTMAGDRTCTAIFNRHSTEELHLLHRGSGSGGVVLHIDAFDHSCPTDCTFEYVDGEEITLLPTPATGSTFTGFGGDPDCEDGLVTLNSNTICTATFELGGDTIFNDGFEAGDTSAWSDTTP